MSRLSALAGLFGLVVLASTGASAPAAASEALPAEAAQRLDGRDLAFTMTAAKQRRLYMMQETARQQRGRGGPGYGRGYGPRPSYGRPGYGPRPYYGRPGYGPPPGYGYRRYDRY
ncbi:MULTISPECIES: hypothetical protein [Hyphomicrobiales]|jgi:hypothetical protein|uniref:Translation initiation factor IF-2 n=1 Tax=Bosea massiliensis TaxID=151419 RepID=A0ABW0P709_9HYPH|nr:MULTISPECIES: hypothetical protein [Hyphomicrobiales]